MKFHYIKNGKTIRRSKQLSLNQAVKFLTENPDNIHEAWATPRCHVAGALFNRVSESSDFIWDGNDRCGCLTEIRRYNARAVACAAFKNEKVDPILTEMIRLDTNIPTDGKDIRPEHLPRFAMWQRFVAEWMKL